MSLEIIMGPMFSGKSTELIRRINRFSCIGKSVLVVNSIKDTRCDEKIKTHDGKTHDAVKVENLMTLNNTYSSRKVNVLAIDEAQFFDDLVPYIKKMLFLRNKRHIIVSGLDGDFKQQKFGSILDLIPLADDVVKLKGFCAICKDGTPAPFTKRLTERTSQIYVSGSEDYMCVCRKHI